MKSNISELVSYCRRSKKHREFSHTSRKQIRTEGTQTVTFTTKQHRLWTRCKNQAKHRKKALLKKSESKSKWITHFPEFKLMIKGFKNNFLLIFYFRKPEYSGCHKYTASNRSLTSTEDRQRLSVGSGSSSLHVSFRKQEKMTMLYNNHLI